MQEPGVRESAPKCKKRSVDCHNGLRLLSDLALRYSLISENEPGNASEAHKTAAKARRNGETNEWPHLEASTTNYIVCVVIGCLFEPGSAPMSGGA